MALLAQISDPHFGTERPDVVKALVQLMREHAPTVVVLSGDITQRARRRQFRAARTFVDRLGAAVALAIPGNHDIPLFNLPARLLAPYANYCHAFGKDLEPYFESKELLVLALNTTRWYRHKDGEVSREQIERVAQRLQQADDRQVRIVVVHHPVAVTRAQDETNLLHGHADAVRSWARAGADLILGGHIHLPFVLNLNERFTDLPRKLWVVQAGTAVSTRVRNEAGNSINFIHSADMGAERSCMVERWDYVAATHSFQRVALAHLRLDSGGRAA